MLPTSAWDLYNYEGPAGLVDAKNKTENASPAMSAEILAQVVAQGPEGLRTANVAKVPDLHNIIIRPTIIRTQQRLGDGRRA